MSTLGNNKKLLVLVRPDRLGDVVVSSAVLRPIIERYGREYQIVWSVKAQYAPLWQGLAEAFRDDAQVHAQIQVQVVPVEKLNIFLKDQAQNQNKDQTENKIEDVTIVFLNPELSLEKEFSSLEYKVFSWGKTLPDRRKRCEKLEAIYAAELLAAAGFPIAIDATALPVISKEIGGGVASGDAGVGAISINEALTLPPKPYVVIHLGAFGQKPSLSEPTIIELTRKLKDKKIEVVWLEGDAGRRASLLTSVGRQMGVLPVYLSKDILALCQLLQNAQAVLGRDSGPTHLAAALGVPTVALVGPLGKTLAAQRWSPVGKKVKILELSTTGAKAVKARWWQSDLAYQRYYFSLAKAELFLKALGELLGEQLSS